MNIHLVFSICIQVWILHFEQHRVTDQIACSTGLLFGVPCYSFVKTGKNGHVVFVFLMCHFFDNRDLTLLVYNL